MGIIKNIFSKQEEETAAPEVKQAAPVNIDNKDEINAVIAAAIHMYLQEVHDFENYSLTIKRIDKIYSPWSSKIYGLRKWPRYI